MTAVFLLLVVFHFSWPGFKAEPLAITLTGIVVIWYTWETNRLKIEMKRQTALMLKPYVVVKPGGGNKRKWDFELVNIGNGSAVAVRIFFQSGRESGWKVPLLTPNGPPYKFSLNIEQEPDQFYLTVSFFDIESNGYSIRNYMDNIGTVYMLSAEEVTDTG